MATHYRWIAGSYIGLVAAGATQLVVRVLPPGMTFRALAYSSAEREPGSR